jgi:hypothetical protein
MPTSSFRSLAVRLHARISSNVLIIGIRDGPASLDWLDCPPWTEKEDELCTILSLDVGFNEACIRV